MSDTSTETPAAQPLSVILGRVANPLLLFSGSLCLLLLLSWMFLLPKFTSVTRPDGVAMTPTALSAYTHQLAAQVSAAEAHRTTLVRAVNDPLYRALLDARTNSLSPLEIEEQLHQAAARISDAKDAVVLSSLTVDGSHVTVEGDVRNVGARSMTILAAFSDELASLPFVGNLQRPPFSRETLPDGSMHSPFHFSFDLTHS